MGSPSPHTKIPHSELDNIVKRWKSGETQRAIGKAYGASDVAVSVMLKKNGIRK